ncbi:hypothetical protein Pint_34943 [Pistacia integerrima]|uniref:Uncharacterized protein n=1 Tax=Pistacia integerrima TaxID=434235 RepID=A0ACC0Y2I9_9ROSI|nr:hypothetical protein Pint_34943 [Pistacia integerrima]
MHQPGIEPGSVPWQGTILPLDHWCSLLCVMTCMHIKYQYFFFNQTEVLLQSTLSFLLINH